MNSSNRARSVRLRGTGQPGTAFPVFRDSHVHLGLVDPGPLPGTGIGAVVDLGWSAGIVDLARAAPVQVELAGRFLTAAGGYPAGRTWAPSDSTVTITAETAAGAVADQVDLGAGVLKVTLNSEAGPVPTAPVLAAVATAAREHHLPLVAHVEGAGAFQSALAAGVDVLAHTPWTAPLDDAEIRGAAASQMWISTLDIHGYGDRTRAQEVALDNLRRFHGAGGQVLYGTDLGNGPLPVGLNIRELELLREAGLDDDEILLSLTVDWPGSRSGPADRCTFVPGDDNEDLLRRLQRARVVPLSEVD